MPETAEQIEIPEDIRHFHRDSLVLDVHLHHRGLVPPVLRAVGRLVNPGAPPPLLPLSALARAGVNGGVVSAVGDGIFSIGRTREGGMRRILGQLAAIRAEIAACNGRVALDAEDLSATVRSGRPAFVLGLEGPGPAADSLERIERLRRAGVRMLTLVHFESNAIGTVERSILRYWSKDGHEKNTGGLTPFGKQAVRLLNRLGVMIDLSHADERTFMDVLAVTKKPVLVSHTGASAISPFHRFISDSAIRAVADNGGIIGLWPFYCRDKGMPGPEDFMAHARHLLRIAGEDHVAIGTDAQGVPGHMAGYRGMHDAPKLTALLFRAGFSKQQAANALGLNFLRVFRDNDGK